MKMQIVSRYLGTAVQLENRILDVKNHSWINTSSWGQRTHQLVFEKVKINNGNYQFSSPAHVSRLYQILHRILFLPAFIVCICRYSISTYTNITPMYIITPPNHFLVGRVIDQASTNVKFGKLASKTASNVKYTSGNLFSTPEVVIYTKQCTM